MNTQEISATSFEVKQTLIWTLALQLTNYVVEDKKPDLNLQVSSFVRCGLYLSMLGREDVV